jgi:hypothetical protein
VLLGILARTLAGVLGEFLVGSDQRRRQRLRVLRRGHFEKALGEGRLRVGPRRDHREEFRVVELGVHRKPEQDDEDLVLWYDGHHSRSRRHRGVGSDDKIDFVDLEQLGVDARHWARRTLIVEVDELDRAPEQAALGVGLFLPDLHAEQRLLAVRRQRASQRHGEADLDWLPGRRLGLRRRQEQGHSGPGKKRDDRAS